METAKTQKSNSTSQKTATNAKSTLIPDNTLITATPEAGRALAIEMAMNTVIATQPDQKIRTELREVYAKDAAMLIKVAQVTAVEFATIAAANNYWRKKVH